MEAYKVRSGTKVIVKDKEVGIPVESIPVYQDEVLTIVRLDGMHCKAINEKGDTVFIKAWTEVELLKTII
tara:strand:- start:504 stop:713 length:210 start_codon:yes stop_codon:yes gene_type:complete